MAAVIAHLNTYFFFPFSIDREAVLEDHQELWSGRPSWIEGLDDWIAAHSAHAPEAVLQNLGPWRRTPYVRFDMESPAYQDMVFFHPYVRRIFFDTKAAERESLLRCYTIAIPEGKKLWFQARDARGREATVEVTDLRLFLFANGIGILSIGVEAYNLPAADALWINEMMRKVYPSSGRQVREGRVPNRLAFALEQDGLRRTLVEETFEAGAMIGFQPPLAETITSLLYFADYAQQEFEPVLDERMIVDTYAAIDPASVAEGFIGSEEYQVLLSRFLYVDRNGGDYRYQREFVRRQMEEQLYRRWAHQGTYYGFTSYSSITLTMGVCDRDGHLLREGFLIHRMFSTRYYLMTLVALFYRATLLDFAERAALVSKRLYRDIQEVGHSPEIIRMANSLRAEFLHFTNYWYFDELANKDEEIEHFTLQCGQYRIEPMKEEIEEEIEKLNAWLDNYYQFRNTEAVNRLALLSLIMGAGAVLTGFFGMNFGEYFARMFFQPDQTYRAVHYTAVILVTVLAFGAISFGLYVVASNWADYKASLIPRQWKRKRDAAQASIKRDPMH